MALWGPRCSHPATSLEPAFPGLHPQATEVLALTVTVVTEVEAWPVAEEAVSPEKVA